MQRKKEKLSKQLIQKIDWLLAMDAFLQGKPPLSYSDEKPSPTQPLNSFAASWAQFVLQAMQQQAPGEKAATIEALAQAFQNRHYDAEARLRYTAFKKILQGSWQSWQERLLQVYWVPHLRIHKTVVSYDPDLSVSLQASTRYQRYDGRHPTQAALAGSHFCQYVSGHPSSAVKSSQILDGAFSAILLNSTGEPQGFVLGLGDGAGGHLGDDAQDRAIGRAAYFASKQASRLLASFPDAKTVKAQVPEIVRHVGQTIRRKTAPFGESTTLTALRGFYAAEQKTMEVAGFQIGDSLILYWHPGTQTLHTLGAAKQWESDHGQQATALLPNAYQPDEIQIIGRTLPLGGIFLACSDGGYEGLPMQMTRLPDPRAGFIRTLMPDTAGWLPFFENDTPDQPEQLLMVLWQGLIAAAEHTRIEKQQAAEKAADDYKHSSTLLFAREEKFKKMSSEEASTLRRHPSYQQLRKKVETASSQLTQSRLGDDVLWCALAWPPHTKSNYLFSTLKRSTIMQRQMPVADEKRPQDPALIELEQKLTQLVIQRTSLKKQSERNVPSTTEAYEATRIAIKELEQKINTLKKFPNPLFVCLRPAVDEEPATAGAQDIMEQALFQKMEGLLEKATPSEKAAWLNACNAYGETLLFLAIRGKCYRLATLLVTQGEMTAATKQTNDKDGQTVLHNLMQQRLLGKPNDQARSVGSLLMQLKEDGLLFPLLQQAEPRHGASPLHVAVEKAVETQQVDLVRCLLSFDKAPLDNKLESTSLLHLTDHEGNTPLHIAIMKHGVSGTGLPIIEELLKNEHLCPFHIRNRAGQSAWELAEALCRSARPLWGQAVLLKLQDARTRYQRRLREWGFVPPGELPTQDALKIGEHAFDWFYEEAVKNNPEQKEHYTELYQRYRQLYAPILQADEKAAQSVIERIGNAYKKDGNEAHQFLQQVEEKRKAGFTQQTSLPPAEKTTADFYEAIEKRTIDAAQYKKLWFSVGAEVGYWPRPNPALVDLPMSIPSLPSEKRYLLGVAAVQSATIPAERWLLAKQVASDPRHQNSATLLQLLQIFPLVQHKAALISCFDFENIEEKLHETLLRPLFGQPVSQLSLRRCRGLMGPTQGDNRRFGRTVWAALFQNNPQIESLELIECRFLNEESMAQLARGCPSLKTLIINHTELKAFHQTQFLGLSSAPLLFPELERLELSDCRELRVLELDAPLLMQFTVHGCDRLTSMVLRTLQLKSIGCRQARSWRVLTTTNNAALAPLAEELKRAATTGLSTVLTSPKKSKAPLHHAIEQGQLAVVRWLVEMGIEINETNQDGKTALHVAAERNEVDIVYYLTTCSSIALSARDPYGNTPLHLAARKGHVDVVAYLCSAGADPFVTNKQYHWPLDLVRLYRQSSQQDNRQQDPEKSLAYAMIENQLSVSMARSQVGEWMIEEAEHAQLDWNCFDVAIDLPRATLVSFALGHQPDLTYRQLLAPEIRTAAALSVLLMHTEQGPEEEDIEKHQAEWRALFHLLAITSWLNDPAQPDEMPSPLKKDMPAMEEEKEIKGKREEKEHSRAMPPLSPTGLPRAMQGERMQRIVNDYYNVHETIKDAVAQCNDLLDHPEGHRLSLMELRQFFKKEEHGRRYSEAYQLMLEIEQTLQPKEEALKAYCTEEKTYAMYVREYYGKNHWFAFQPATAGEEKDNRSMVDIAARCIGKPIIIHQQKGAHYEEIYRTEEQQDSLPQHVHYDGDKHFVKLQPNPLYWQEVDKTLLACFSIFKPRPSDGALLSAEEKEAKYEGQGARPSVSALIRNYLV